MFSTTRRFQPATGWPTPPNRPRFGKQIPPEPPLGSYESVLGDVTSLQNYPTNHLDNNFSRISPRARAYLSKLSLQVTPEALRCYESKGMLGTVEESADLLLEAYTLQAQRQGIIRQDMTDQWHKVSVRMQRDGEPFFNFLKQIETDLPDAKIAEFQRMVGVDEAHARTLLTLICCKFALLKDDFNGKSDFQFSKPRVVMEAKELGEYLPRFSRERLKLLGASKAFSCCPWLPTDWLRKLTLHHVQNTLQLPVNHDDLMKYVFDKQLVRQELNYDAPETTYAERKAIYKPFELFYEAAMLQQAEERARQSSRPRNANRAV